MSASLMEIDWAVFPTGEYKKDRDAARRFYAGIGVVRCPALGDVGVVFGAAGFKHLVYKPSRTDVEIIERLMLLQYAKRVVSEPTASMTYRVRKETYNSTKFGEKRRVVFSAYYWGLSSTVNGKKITVVIRQIERGGKYFYSIMKR